VDPKDVENEGMLWKLFTNWKTAFPLSLGLSIPLFAFDVRAAAGRDRGGRARGRRARFARDARPRARRTPAWFVCVRVHVVCRGRR
jgi:hypothetical protein